MSFLLDTNVISELRKGNRCDPGVREWLAGVKQEEIFLSSLTLGELRKGIELIRRRDPRSARVLEGWLREVLVVHSDRILPVDTAVAEEWGCLNVPDPRPVIDSLLAATAKVHDLVLVTRNVKDIEGTGARWLNPFKN